jgi:hypothetical protein
MAADASFSEARWARVMPKHSSDGIWHQDGCAGSVDELPISEGLRAGLLAWADRYDEFEDHLPEAERRPFDVQLYATEGLAIARAIKAALPEWTVIYFDISRCRWADREQPREEFEYEVE